MKLPLYLSTAPKWSLLLLLVTLSLVACKKRDHHPFSPDLTDDFKQVNLVANKASYNPIRVDPTLVNPWGLDWNAAGTVAWPASEGTGLSQLYRNDAGITSPRDPVAIPSPGGPAGGHPTGIVFNASGHFKVPNTTGAKAAFIFAGVDGNVSGWSGGNNAIAMVNNSANSAYTGLAIAADGVDSFLYAADFRGAEIDVWDKEYKPVTTKAFDDPNLPAGYAPFNIQTIDNLLYVLYAKVGAMGFSEAGKGLGYVNVFYPNGQLKRRLISKGQLNAPWGIAKTSADFLGQETKTNGRITGTIFIVGNFGNGQMNVYTEGGDFVGTMKDDSGPIVIEGLWALSFPPASSNPAAFDRMKLFFTAGPNAEKDGLFGYLSK